MTRAELIARLEQAAEGSRECIIWPRKLDKHGRGRIWHDGKLMLASRWVWERTNGPIPMGKLVCHHCDNPSCINLKHLYVGTHADNMRDMRERKRSFGATQRERITEIGRQLGLRNTWARGSGNPKAKLTVEQVKAIQCDARQTRLLVAEYGVNRATIQRIRNGTAWTS